MGIANYITKNGDLVNHTFYEIVEEARKEVVKESE